MITPNAKVHALEPYRAKYGTIHSVAPLAAVSVEVRQAYRLSAIEADSSSTSMVSLSLLWRQLTLGTSCVADGFFFEDRCYLVLSLKTGGVAMPAEARRMKILEVVLGGVRQKNIALDMSLAPSTVAMDSKLALTGLGVNCKPSRAHPLLMLAARAFREGAVVLARCSTLVGRDDRELRVISMLRPDRRLAMLVPSAELAVIRSVVEGLSYEEIARQRGTSTRTIANQISAVFRRLRVSGRNELVQRLFFDQASGQHAPMPISETLVPPGADPKATEALGNTRRSA